MSTDESNVHRLPAPTKTYRTPPQHLVQPCDYALVHVIFSLEEELGLIEAYNRLCDAAHGLKSRIDAGQAGAKNPR